METRENKQASWRIVCDINGVFRVEVLDKAINWWYIAASKLGVGDKGLKKAIDFCEQHFKNTLK